VKGIYQVQVYHSTYYFYITPSISQINEYTINSTNQLPQHPKWSAADVTTAPACALKRQSAPVESSLRFNAVCLLLYSPPIIPPSIFSLPPNIHITRHLTAYTCILTNLQPAKKPSPRTSCPPTPPPAPAESERKMHATAVAPTTTVLRAWRPTLLLASRCECMCVWSKARAESI
jgi:hypothetical protein